jgi:predicted phosphodiesterase
MRYYIFSDLHIGDNDVNYASLAATFKNIGKEDKVVLVGDIIENWTKDYRYSVIEHYSVVKLLLERVDYWVIGNHDSFLKPFAYADIPFDNVIFVYPRLLLEVDNKTWIIEHGHLLGKYGFVFKFLDRFDDTKIFRDISTWMASRKCFSSATKKKGKRDSSIEKEVLNLAKQYNADIVVFGHTHQSCKISYKIDCKDVLVINPGDSSSYVVYENGEFEIIG